ncbi:hypothetical protein DFQ30_001692 [Apophysomyces sp. BC1015]|nr:hypothetical protein DFQ30_001692 [Apophysomyces sp. BC1015]
MNTTTTSPLFTATLSDAPDSINTQPILSPEVQMEDTPTMTAKERAAQDIAELKAQLADLTAQMASATCQGNMEIKLNLRAAVKELCEDIEELECSEKVYQNEEKKDPASVVRAPHNLPLFQ